MLLKVNKNRTVDSVGTWGTVNENDYEILNFEFPEELDEYNKRIVYYLGDERVWDTIVNNKAYITNAITTKGDVQAYVWCTKENTEREADTDFRTMLFEMHFYENENADGIVPTEEQVDGFNTMLTAMNAKIDEVDALEQTIETAETERQEAETTRVSNETTRESNEATRQSNEQTRQTQEADRERRTDEAIASIEDKTEEYNQNAQEKTDAFNNNATQKTNDFNSNATQKVNDFNSNANSKTSNFNSNASDKTSAFNTNAQNKTDAFDTNASSKTTAFNNNASSKTTDFNSNATAKTNDFNSNATDKTDAFNSNAEDKTDDFDENAETKTNEFNDNATAKTEEFDEHTEEISAEIEELQQEVKELSQNMPWNETEQATEIDITDAAKYSKNKLELFGNTEQTQYSGKNFFHVNDSSASWGTLTFALVNNIINISIGDGNGGLGQNAQGDYTNYNFDTSKDYYFSIYQKEGDLRFKESATSKWFRAVIYIKYSDDTTSSNHIAITTGMQSKNEKITFTEGKTPVAFAIGRYSPSNTLENNQSAQYYVQLEQGDTATDYEPYVGGVTAPNQDYPQDIHVVTGNNTIGVTGKNLCKSFANGTTTNRYNASIYVEADFEVGKKYVISFIDKSVGNSYYRNENFMINPSSYSIASTGTRQSYYFECKNNDKSSATTYKVGSGFLILKNNDTLSQLPQFEDVQVEEVETYNVPATSYEPYTHTDYPINLGNIELCKIGDYQDYLYKENGNWYKYGIFQKIIFNGTEGWYEPTINNYNILNIRTNSVLTSANGVNFIGLADKFRKQTTIISNTKNEGFFNASERYFYLRFYINRVGVTSEDTTSEKVQKVKYWLSNNNVTLINAKDTPTLTQITDETLISQLEAIYNHLALVKGTNHITITPSDLEPYVTLNYMQDLPAKLDNLDSRLSLLE